MSPNGVFDRRAKIRSLGSLPLYLTNQGVVESGAAIDEQLAARGVAPADLDAVLLSHLDCDHANGLKLVKVARVDQGAKSGPELRRVHRQPRSRCRAAHNYIVKRSTGSAGGAACCCL